MATYFIAVDGSDSLGDGSYPNPYKTLAKATSVISEGDIIEYGVGTFNEIESVTINTLQFTIKGQGWDLTKVRFLTSVGKGVIFDTPSADAEIVVKGITFEGRDDVDLFFVDFGGATSRITFWRCVFLPVSGYTVQSLTQGNAINVCHCVVASKGDMSAKGFWSPDPYQITVVNCVFYNLALVVDDEDRGSEGLGQAIYSDNNLYYGNLRLFRVGDFGDSDFKYDFDPRFVNSDEYDFNPLLSSPLIEGGKDLVNGFGDDNTQSVPLSLTDDLGYVGNFPDVGVEEVIIPSGRTHIIQSNIAMLLGMFSEEYSRTDIQLQYLRKGRFLKSADAKQMSKRWGDLMGIYRLSASPYTMDTNSFRSFIRDILRAIKIAPAVGAQKRACGGVAAVEPWRVDYWDDRRFPVGTDLKLSVDTPPSLTLALTAGRVQLARRWYDVSAQTLVLPSNSSLVIFLDGTLDSNYEAEMQYVVAGGEHIKSWIDVSITGTAAFEKDSQKVYGLGTNFFSTLIPHIADEFHTDDTKTGSPSAPFPSSNITYDETFRRVRVGSSPYTYQVESVESDTELTLTFPFRENSVTGIITGYKPIFVLGEVTTDATSITDIVCPGRVGTGTAISNALSVKNHGYEFHVPIATDVAQGVDEMSVLLRSLLARLVPIHKLGYLFSHIPGSAPQLPGVIIHAD